MNQMKSEYKWMKLDELEVDRRIQRGQRKPSRVEYLVRNWNEGAVGVVTVSHRANGANVIIDGDHRTEAKKFRTVAGEADVYRPGEIFCEVFEDLTLAEEGTLFLDKNPGNQPSVVDKYNVGVEIEEDQPSRIDRIVHSRGFKVDNQAANGHINAIRVLRQIDDLSMKLEAEPHLLDITLMVIGRAWGNDRYGVQAANLLGVARMFAEYGDRINIDDLIDKMHNYRGGPSGLIAGARQIANVQGRKVAMAVAEILVNTYNKNKTRNQLTPWRYSR
jgi:hypothetical protein